MRIEVSDKLLAVIRELENYERALFASLRRFSWTYSEDGRGAVGEASGHHSMARYFVSLESGGGVQISRQELDKYEYVDLAEHPLSTDFDGEV